MRLAAPVNTTPWARQAVSPGFLAEAGRRAHELHAGLGLLARSPEGPYVVDIAGRGAEGRHLRILGADLEEAVAEALARFAAGADDTGIRWLAGGDHLSHGHRRGLPRTLCGIAAIGEQFTHPEHARCRSCLRSLDRVGVAV